MAGKYSGILLCSDFDGTLAYDGRTVSRENREAILRFEEQGGLFTMASGRYPGHFLDIEGLVLNTYAITLNGNVIYDLAGDQLISLDALDAATVGDFVTVLNGLDGWQHLRVCALEGEFGYQRGQDQPVSDFIAEIGASRIAKLVTVNDPAIGLPLRTALTDAFPLLTFTLSWPAGLETNAAAGGKGNAVRKLRGLLGGREKIHTVVCAGDYENDISMLAYADIGYAVANAIDSVKAVADRITVSCRDHAIARIIDEL